MDLDEFARIRVPGDVDPLALLLELRKNERCSTLMRPRW